MDFCFNHRHSPDAFFLSKWAKKKFELTGIALPVKTINTFSFLAIAVCSYILLRGPLGFDIPVLGKFNFKGGGQIPLPLFSFGLL